MYICLNRATAGRNLAFEEFVKLASDAGFAGADVELGWARQRSADALHELFESRRLRFGGWGVPFDWRGEDKAQRAMGSRTSTDSSALATQLHIDSCATWIMPSSDRRFIENWMFHVERLRPGRARAGGTRAAAGPGVRRAVPSATN